jgi:hypothetical protein
MCREEMGLCIGEQVSDVLSNILFQVEFSDVVSELRAWIKELVNTPPLSRANAASPGEDPAAIMMPRVLRKRVFNPGRGVF